MAVIQWLKRREVMHRAEELLKECCQRLDLGEKSFGKGAREWISRRRWTDDPAQMRRLIYHAALTASGPVLEAAHFPPRLKDDHEAYLGASFESIALEDAVRQKLRHFFEKIHGIEVCDVYKAVSSRMERPLIEECLAWANGNKLKAARALGINRNTLHKKIRELGIQIVR